jgi:hypothetical protein
LSKKGARSLWLMMVLAMRVRESNSSSIGQESLLIRELVWSSFDSKKIFSWKENLIGFSAKTNWWNSLIKESKKWAPISLLGKVFGPKSSIEGTKINCKSGQLFLHSSKSPFSCLILD